jgi:hypothetical protein
MVIGAMEVVNVDMILGTSEHWQQLKASWFVWVPFGIKEFACNIEGPSSMNFANPTNLMRKWGR